METSGGLGVGRTGNATALVFLATPTLADVAGTATAIDGETIEVHGQRIREAVGVVPGDAARCPARIRPCQGFADTLASAAARGR